MKKIIENYIVNCKRYSFLLGQLVERDFKTKYKRSVLGVLWSMLNPLLTMSVQYMVFVNLFRWDIENYAVYLLVGTVVFNFFLRGYTMGANINYRECITDHESICSDIRVPSVKSTVVLH